MPAHVRPVNGQLMRTNMALLFPLSLVLFATAYPGEHYFGRSSIC